MNADVLPPKVISWPHKAAQTLGQEGTQEIVDLINQAVAAVGVTKIDKSDYDAHAHLISSQFDSLRTEFSSFKAEMKAEMKSQIRGALLAGLAWTTVLIAGLFGAINTFLRG